MQVGTSICLTLGKEARETSITLCPQQSIVGSGNVNRKMLPTLAVPFNGDAGLTGIDLQ